MSSPSEPPPAPPPADPPALVWLVQLHCHTCAPGYYCIKHFERNWWLQNYRPK